MKTSELCASGRMAAGVSGVPPDGPSHMLAHKLTCSGLQCQGSILKSVRVILEETELPLFRVRAGGPGPGEFPVGMEELAEPFLSC